MLPTSSEPCGYPQETYGYYDLSWTGF